MSWEGSAEKSLQCSFPDATSTVPCNSSTNSVILGLIVSLPSTNNSATSPNRAALSLFAGYALMPTWFNSAIVAAHVLAQHRRCGIGIDFHIHDVRLE